MKRTIRTVLLIGALGVSGVMASEVIATVNGDKITKEDANAFLQQIQPNQPISFDMLDPQTRKKVVDGLIETELMAQAAQKAGVEKDPEYQRMLDLAKKKLMINQWAKQQYEKTIVSESEAKEFYDKNAQKFMMPEQVHARHILLKDEKSAQELIDQLKGLKGEELKKKFIELAKEKSSGPTGPKGGDLGYFTKDQMVVPFSKAAFALKKGEITPKPVQTQFGWHVIYIEDHKAAQKIPFEQIKEKVIQNLKQQRFTERMKKESEQLKAQSKIDYLDASLKGKASAQPETAK